MVKTDSLCEDSLTLRFLVGADVPPDPDSGAAGTVYQTNVALRALGCEVEEFWAADVGRRIRHGNLHYAIELPWAYRREVARRLSKRDVDVVMLSQPHAYLAGEYIKRHHPGVLFFNRTHGWEGQYDEARRTYFPGKQEQGRPIKLARDLMEKLLRTHQKRVIDVSDAVVSGSAGVADYLERVYGYPRYRVAVLPHGVPDAFVRVSPSVSDNRWRKLLYVGQFAEFKAPEILAAVFNEILRAYPDVCAGWLCDLRDHDRIRKLIKSEFADRITLYSWMPQSELIKVYDQYGLFIFPSFYEGYGKAPFEAMARGLAVVSSRVGGMADLIRTGENGFLVEPGRTGDFVDVIRQLLAYPDRAKAAGTRARETALQLTWENLARGLITFAEGLKRD